MMISYCNPKHGDDATAVVGDESRPFKTQRAAMEAAQAWMRENKQACTFRETHRAPRASVDAAAPSAAVEAA